MLNSLGDTASFALESSCTEGPTSIKTLDKLENIPLYGRSVLIRVDFNVPLKEQQILDTTRLESAKKTILFFAERGARVILLSHLGRPKGVRKEECSLKPLVGPLEKILGRKVKFVAQAIGPEAEEQRCALADGEILLLENLRFYPGEESNEGGFAQSLAKGADFYVNDAFSVCHRAHASTFALAKRLPAYAGYALQSTCFMLRKTLGSACLPLMAIVGGAKISTKFDLLNSLIEKADILAIGGAMANSFWAAQGLPIGESLYEPEVLEKALRLIEKAKDKNCQLLLPEDVVVASRFEAYAPHQVFDRGNAFREGMILDLGPKSVAQIEKALKKAATLVWNGPVGAFELPPFDKATSALAVSAAAQTRAGKLISVVGGGDTLAAIAPSGCLQSFTYASTAGGAFLEWLEGKPLPGLAVLENQAKAP